MKGGRNSEHDRAAGAEDSEFGEDVNERVDARDEMADVNVISFVRDDCGHA
jgi:hypothetical protein